MAAHLEMDYAAFAALTSANFDRLFPKAAKAAAAAMADAGSAV